MSGEAERVAPEFGPPCPGCTVEAINKQIERFPAAFPLCKSCRDGGALYHAQVKPQWNRAMDDVVREARERKKEGSRG